jgi:ribosomal protein S20
LNQYILKNDEKNILKIINSDLKKFIYAKDNQIRHEGNVIFTRLIEKYPNMADGLIGDLKALYLSEVEQRTIALDLFGMIYDQGLSDSYLRVKIPEVLENLPVDWANRKQEMENSELQKKWDAIKQDVTQLRINESWKSGIQKIARDYNNAIKIKDMKSIMEAVRKVVDIFMRERNEELQDQANQVLGLIAKQNIELIQPTIDLFLQLLEGKDVDKKSRAIKGLGEVTRQRPGWSYFGIEKLIYLAEHDSEEDFRMKAMLEINRIAEKDPVMLIEYIPSITTCLVKDPNKHVRRLAALCLGNLAPAIATIGSDEQQKVISALTDALHDEYMLVRKFADTSLTAIRGAMRKLEEQK